jgi:hypothetical protein
MRRGKTQVLGSVLGDCWEKIHEATIASLSSATKLLIRGDSIGDATGKAITNTEAYDSYTKLMIHMEGTTTSFVDSATAKSITVVNQTTQSTTQFKFGSKAGYFDGSGDALTLADSADWDFGAGDFTVDTWVRFNETGNNVVFAHQTDDPYVPGNSNVWRCQLYTNKLRMDFWKAGVGLVGSYDMTSNWAYSANVWYHLAFIRNGTVCLIFVDGVSQTLTETQAIGGTTLGDCTGLLYIGGSAVGGGSDFDGYLDEYRISKGIARWTANFNPPITAYGLVASLSSQYKFNEVGKSLAFCGLGSDECLSLADSADWTFGTGNFTLDLLANFNHVGTLGDDKCFMIQRVDASNYWCFYITDGTTISFLVTLGGVTKIYTQQDYSFAENTWYHIAYVRNGTEGYIFVNGTKIRTDTTIGTTDITDLATGLIIGYMPNYTKLDGYLSMVRITKGTALWTSNFTPPIYTDYYGAATQYVITGLDGDEDEEYQLITRIVNNYNGPVNYYLRPNNDSTAGHYGYQDLNGDNTSVAAYRGTESGIYLTGVGALNEVFFSKTILYSKSGYVRTALVSAESSISGTTVGGIWLNGFSWNNSADNITSLQVFTEVANGLGVGSVIELWKKSKKV